jgi:hypothetical protein
MRYIQLIRAAVLLFPFLSLVVVSGCSGSPGSKGGGASVNQDSDRHRSGQERPGGMMGGGMMGGGM